MLAQAMAPLLKRLAERSCSRPYGPADESKLSTTPFPPSDTLSRPMTPGSVTVKSALETSKKTLPTASTLTRACVVATFGSVTACEPSFGVLAASTIGYVWPPSVESEIFTFAVLTGGGSVPATFQVTVRVEPAVH